MAPTPSPRSPTTASALQIVFDPESLLLDTAAGVRHALMTIGCARDVRWLQRLDHDDLRAQPLADLIADLAGSKDHGVVTELIRRFQRVYEQDSRYRAPLRPGAEELLQLFRASGFQLHYISALGPQAATRLVHRLGLQATLATVYTPPTPVCPGARALLFEHFVASREHPPAQFLLISDHLAELYAAQRLGIAALAFSYGHTPPAVLDAAAHVVGMAHSAADVGHWLHAHIAARACLRCAPRHAHSALH